MAAGVMITLHVDGAIVGTSVTVSGTHALNFTETLLATPVQVALKDEAVLPAPGDWGDTDAGPPPTGCTWHSSRVISGRKTFYAKLTVGRRIYMTSVLLLES